MPKNLLYLADKLPMATYGDEEQPITLTRDSIIQKITSKTDMGRNYK
jgi:hypothetical protein